MKSITIHLDDDVVKRLQSLRSVRAISGTSFGIQDEFMSVLLKALVDGVAEKTFSFAPQHKEPF